MKIRYPLAALLALSLAASLGFSQGRYTVSDENAAGPGSPRVVVLRDSVGGAEAAIAPSEGGELSSYRVKLKGGWIELLYHARDYSPGPGFKGKAPLLWPAVGAQYPLGTVPKTSCGNGAYQSGGKTYPMPCHGFARTLPWKEVSRSADKQGARVTVELLDSPRTRTYYPFAFRLDATFLLAGGHLTIDYTVQSDSSNSQPMVFSIGNHIAFKIPFLPGTDPANMTFETPSTMQMLRNAQGLLSGKEQPRSFESPQRLGAFDAHVAIPLAGYRSQPFARLSDPQGVTLRITPNCEFVSSRAADTVQYLRRPESGIFQPGALVWHPEFIESA